MKFVERDFGFATADGEGICLRYQGGDLTLSFIDWAEQRREIIFSQTLAFRWQEQDAQEDSPPRDDTTYEVVDSPWLSVQAKLYAVASDEFAHYKLCFNACGVLDVLSRRR